MPLPLPQIPLKSHFKVYERVGKMREDPELGFHVFCEELLRLMVGRFPEIGDLLKKWRSLPKEVRSRFQKREEEEDKKEKLYQKYLETIFLEWEECREIEKIVSTFEPWEEQKEEVTRKSTLEKVKILIQERKQQCLEEVMVKEGNLEVVTLGNEGQQQSWLTDGLLPEQERGEQTPGAPRSGAEAARVNRSRGGRLRKMQRLLNFQSKLCTNCGLPPTRLMEERRKKRTRVETFRKRRTQLELEVKGEEDSILFSTPSKVRLDLTEKEEVVEPDAGLKCQEGGNEWRRNGEVGGGPGLQPTLAESVTASRIEFPRMLRQAYVGDMVEAGLPGRGPEVMWVDHWTGQGWAGPLGSVYFCTSCQLAGGTWRV